MNDRKKVTTVSLREMKAAGEKITGLTAWDFVSAGFADAAGVDIILVGDSLSMTIRGDKNTLGITVDHMIYHSKMVARGVERALVVGDMPFMSYQISSERALVNAGRFLKEGGAEAVKIEGGRDMADTVKRIVTAGIPVMGHIGLMPQSVHQVGGMKVQGKSVSEAKQVLEDAEALQEAGVFSIVLECLPLELSKKVTETLNIPTIGIGAGVHCDGQIQVTADVIGLLGGKMPRHARKYVDMKETITATLSAYIDDVRKGNFPALENSFEASVELKEALNKDISR